MWILAWKEVVNLRFRALLTLLGLAIGTFALTTMGSMSLHFRHVAARFESYTKGKIFLRERTGFLGAGALSEEEILALKKNPAISDAIPILVARLRSREFIVFGLPQIVLGLPLEKVTALAGDVPLLTGRWPQSLNECVLGADIAEQSGVSQRTSFLYEGKTFQVTGIMSRMNGPEDREVILSLAVLESLLGREGLVSYGIIIPKPNQNIESLLHSIAASHPRWDVLPPSVLALEVRKGEMLWNALTTGTAMIAALVGGLGILTIMMMAVQERIPEIAISKALGASQGQIFGLFMAESLILSGMGSLIGFFLSYLFVGGANQFLSKQGMVLFEPSARLLILNFGAAILLALIGGLYPAYYGSRIKPAEALRR